MKIIPSLLLSALSISASAQAVRGAPIRVVTIYLSPDMASARLGDIDRGREVIILETTPKWVHVEANLTEERIVTGWIPDQGVVRASTPNGDEVLFGEAVESEDEASRRNGRRGAAQDALRLYYDISQYFPTSPRAAEGMYRSADIRWQIDKADVMSRPSAKEQDPNLRTGMEEQYMKEVIKKYPGTKWADLAAFHLIENKLCGDWEAQAKCPEREAELYEKFASDHAQSSVTAEALYDAAYRRAALVDIYKNNDQGKKSDEARGKAVTIAQRVVTQFPQSDWAARAQRLLFMMQQGMPTFGNN